MATLKIPASIADATRKLTGIERLLQATQWERSAIVRAFCGKQQGKRLRSNSIEVLSIDEFAELGIVGLRSKNAVRRYYDSWELSGKPEPEPGQEVEMPDVAFPSLQELQDSKESAEAVHGFARKTREAAAMLHEYDEKFWPLLDDPDLQYLQETLEDIIEILLNVDPDRLVKIIHQASEELEEGE